MDLLNITREIESLGSFRWREFGSRYTVLVAHVLSGRYQPANCFPSRSATIDTQRRELATLLCFSPGLKPERAEVPRLAYRYARQTHLPLTKFREVCPLTLADVQEMGLRG